MKHAIAGLSTVALASGLLDPFTSLSDATCGNCIRRDAEGFLRCNTGGHPSKIPYYPNQDFTSVNATKQADIDFHGFSTATVLKSQEVRNLANCGSTTCPAGTSNSAYERMFCSAYLDRYRDGTTTAQPAGDYSAYGNPYQGNGAMCVRASSQASIMQADEDARKMYEYLGTRNGYASSYTLNKGSDVSEEARRWGTEFNGDVPANWCGTYMKYMLCGVAFPQVALSEAVINANRTSVWGAKGNLRPIEYDSCENLHAACVRHEPDEDTEAKGDYVHPDMNDTRGLYFQNDDQDEREDRMDQSLLCTMWSRGHGLAAAGTPIIDNDGEGIIEFDAAGALHAPLLLVAAAVVALVM